MGRILHVFAYRGDPPAAVREPGVRAEPGIGIPVDERWPGFVAFGSTAMIGEIKQRLHLPLLPSETGNNVIVDNGDLAGYLGKTFRAGTATFKGVRLLHYGEERRPAMTPRIVIGLLAEVVEEGMLDPDDRIELV